MNQTTRTAGTLRVSTDAANSVGRQALARPRSGKKRPPPERKILKLLSRVKYWKAIAQAAFAVLEENPELRDRARVGAFIGALDSLVTDRPEFRAALSNAAPRMAPAAAGLLMADLEAGPRAVLELARNPQLAERIAGLEPVEQGIELGKLLAAVQLSGNVTPLYGPRP